MKITKFLIPVLGVVGFAIYLSLFTVKEINQAIVLQFGDPKKVIAEPGLQVKIPFVGVSRHEAPAMFSVLQPAFHEWPVVIH